MVYELSEYDVYVIESSLKSHLKQCEEFVRLDNKVKTFTIAERVRVENKIERIKNLLEKMQFTIL